jgi:heat shock protein HslJ
MDTRSVSPCSWIPRLALALILIAMIPACSTNRISGQGSEHRSAPPPGPWILMALLEDNQVPAIRITLAVDQQGRLSGEAGCNRWMGEWVLTEAGVSLAPVATTRKICPPEVMELETRFLDALSRTGGWQMTDRGLMLTDSGKTGLLLFKLETP